MVLAVTMVMSAFAVPAAAGQGDGGDRGEERGREKQDVSHIRYLDAEVRVIGGQPLIVGDGNVTLLPVRFPETVLVDGQAVPLVVRNGAVVVPTEDGPVAVPVSDFDVATVDGQVMFVAEENPLIFIAAGAILGGMAGIGTGAAAVAGLKYVGVAVGAGAAKAIVATGAVTGALLGGAAASR